MQITVPPNVPGGQAGKKLLARMKASHALAGLDGVERLYRLTRKSRRGMGDTCVDPESGESINCPGSSVDLSNYMGQFGWPASGSPPIISATPPNTTPAAPSTSTWDRMWQNLIAGWSSTGQQILKQQNLPTGVYMQTGPNGTVYYTQPAGNPQNILSAAAGNLTAGVGSGSMTPIMLAGLGLLAVFVVMQMNRR